MFVLCESVPSGMRVCAVQECAMGRVCLCCARMRVCACESVPTGVCVCAV